MCRSRRSTHARWRQSYIETDLEREVRTVRQVGDLMTVQSFLRLLAARSGQILNMTGIATELGLTLAATKPEGLRPAVQPGYVVYAGDRVVPLGILRIHGRLAQG